MLVAGAAVLALLFHVLDLQVFLKGALEWIRAQGAWAPLVFVLAYVTATVLFVPGLILSLGAGVLFGVVRGSVYVSIGSTLGATAAFLLARYLARDRVSRWIEGRKGFEALDRAVAREGWKIVGLVRLSPLFPFNLLNYAFGLTGIPLLPYLLASWAGMIPGTVLYVYVGSLIGSIASLGGERPTHTWWERAFYVLGFLATAAVTLHVTRLARRALKARMQEPGEDGPP